MLRRAKTILNTTGFTALYDKGFHTGSEIKTGMEMGIDIMVAIPDEILRPLPIVMSVGYLSYKNFTYFF